jgi:hypothetical protein
MLRIRLRERSGTRRRLTVRVASLRVLLAQFAPALWSILAVQGVGE